MELITKQSVVDTALERWAYQYRNGYMNKGSITNALLALPKPINADDVNRIIGNDSWTSLTCDECGKEVDAVVMLGQEPDHDSSTAYICKKCLISARKLFTKGP